MHLLKLAFSDQLCLGCVSSFSDGEEKGEDKKQCNVIVLGDETFFSFAILEEFVTQKYQAWYLSNSAWKGKH